MKCEICREMLWAYLEQDLNAEEAAEMEQHLAVCADCQAEAKVQKEIMDSLRSLSDEALPDGYHTELMQKLGEEAAKNVVSFPKIKKQPKWKQLSLIAAAVLIVIAAGGVKGMMQMREGQNQVARQMKASANETASVSDEAAPLESRETEDSSAAMDQAAKQPFEMQQKGVQTEDNQKKAASGGEAEDSLMEARESDAKEKAKDMGSSFAGGGMDAAMPEETSVMEDEWEAPYSMMRSAAPLAPTDTAILQVTDLETAMAAIRDTMIAAEGYEEVAAEENSIYAVIPVEHFDAFAKALEDLGTLQWTQKGTLAEGDAYRSVEIQLDMK